MTLALLVACGDANPAPDIPPPHTLSLACPGDPRCPDADGVLQVGAAVADILPSCWERWDDEAGDATWSRDDPFHDCGCDHVCVADGAGVPDKGEGDGVFDAIWLAGFGHARAATGVRGADRGLVGEGDGLQVRALALERGSTAVGIVVFDAVGVMYDDVERLRADVEAAGLPYDHVIVHSSHVHASPDTMGIWGPSIVTTGYDAETLQEMRAAAVAVLDTAWQQRTEATLRIGTVDATDYADNGVANLVVDTRDPVIVDPRVGVATFESPEGAPIATLVHFANHPETVASGNTLVTSDYVHALRRTVEVGSVWESGGRAGVGGVALFLNGTVGGMMTSLGAEVHTPDGDVWAAASFEKADAVGQLLGEMALDAIDAAEPVDTDLALGVQELFLRVDNYAFQAMFLLGVLAHREAENYDPEQTITVENTPEIRTEVDLLRVGPLTLLTWPGEPLPETFVGGYDGRWTPPGSDLVSPDNPLPPDLAAAPSGPSVEDGLPGSTRWVVGLGNDAVGYMIPPYDFVVADAGAYILEPEGDHYEETNSLGVDTLPRILEATETLNAWAR